MRQNPQCKECRAKDEKLTFKGSLLKDWQQLNKICSSSNNAAALLKEFHACLNILNDTSSDTWSHRIAVIQKTIPQLLVRFRHLPLEAN